MRVDEDSDDSFEGKEMMTPGQPSEELPIRPDSELLD